MIVPTGDLFIATYVKNKLLGQGTLYSENIQIKGRWNGDDKVEGVAYLIEKVSGQSQIRSIYKGHLEPETFFKVGEGELSFELSGDKFIGRFKKGIPVQGGVHYSDGGKYNGSLNNAMKRNGWGTYTYPDGHVFTGNWFDGKQGSSNVSKSKEKVSN